MHILSMLFIVSNLLADSQAVIVCCTLQVSYGLLGVGVYR